MGGGKDQKQANQMLRQQQQTESARTQEFHDRNIGDIGAARGRADDLYGSMRGGYQGLIDNPIALAAGGGGGGGGGGGDGRFGEAENSYRMFMNTGGWDSGRVASQDANIARLKGLGYDPETVNRMRGGGVYDEFSKTGGLDEAARGNIRARSTSVIPSFFGRLRDEGNRMAAVQGGYGPGRQAMQSRLAREQAGAGQEAARAAEMGIMDQVNQGRRWGAEGMTSSESALGDLRLRSTSSASDVERMMMDSINQGKLQGTGGLLGMAESDRAAGAASGARGDAMDRWAAEFQLQQKMAGLEGLGGLYTSSPQEYMDYNNLNLANRGLGASSVGDLAMKQKTGNKSWKDYAAAGIGAGLGAFL